MRPSEAARLVSHQGGRILVRGAHLGWAGWSRVGRWFERQARELESEVLGLDAFAEPWPEPAPSENRPEAVDTQPRP